MVRKLKKIKRVAGTKERPRLSVYRSLQGLYAQFVDDDEGVTLLGVSSLSKDMKKQLNGKNNLETAKQFGQVVAKKAIEKNIKQVVFDRGAMRYHGRIKALADAARAAGLIF